MVVLSMLVLLAYGSKLTLGDGLFQLPPPTSKSVSSVIISCSFPQLESTGDTVLAQLLHQLLLSGADGDTRLGQALSSLIESLPPSQRPSLSSNDDSCFRQWLRGIQLQDPMEPAPVVTAQDKLGNLLLDVPVSLSLARLRANMVPDSAVVNLTRPTASPGLAMFNITADLSPGLYQAAIEVEGAAEFFLVAVPLMEDVIMHVLTPPPDVVLVGKPLAMDVKVTDLDGKPLEGAVVSLLQMPSANVVQSLELVEATPSHNASYTDATGVASMQFMPLGTNGTELVLNVTCEQAEQQFTMTLLSPASELTITQQPAAILPVGLAASAPPLRSLPTLLLLVADTSAVAPMQLQLHPPVAGYQAQVDVLQAPSYCDALPSVRDCKFSEDDLVAQVNSSQLVRATVLYDESVVSDANGVYTFRNFTFSTGSTGTYVLRFSILGATALSEPVRIINRIYPQSHLMTFIIGRGPFMGFLAMTLSTLYILWIASNDGHSLLFRLLALLWAATIAYSALQLSLPTLLGAELDTAYVTSPVLPVAKYNIGCCQWSNGWPSAVLDVALLLTSGLLLVVHLFSLLREVCGWASSHRRRRLRRYRAHVTGLLAPLWRLTATAVDADEEEAVDRDMLRRLLDELTFARFESDDSSLVLALRPTASALAAVCRGMLGVFTQGAQLAHASVTACTGSGSRARVSFLAERARRGWQQLGIDIVKLLYYSVAACVRACFLVLGLMLSALTASPGLYRRHRDSHRSRWRAPFYYSPRFLLGASASMWFVTLAALGTAILGVWLRYWLLEAARQYKLLRLRLDSGVPLALSSSRYNPNDLLWLVFLGSITDRLALFSGEDKFTLLADVLPYFIAGQAALAWIIVLAYWVAVAVSHRRQLLRMRIGQFPFARSSHVPVSHASRFIGYQIIHSLVGYIVMSVVLLLLAAMLAAVSLVPSLSDLVATLVVRFSEQVLAPAVAVYIAFVLIGLLLVSRKNRVRSPLLFAIYDFAMLPASLLVGLVIVVKRLLYTLSSLLFRLWTPDRCWTPEYESADSLYEAYSGMLMSEHSFNNPIALVFIDVMAEAARQRPGAAAAAAAAEAASSCCGGGGSSAGQQRAVASTKRCCWRLCGQRSSQRAKGSGGGKEVVADSDLDARNRLVRHTRSIRARQRWWLALVLARNPSLRRARKGGSVRLVSAAVVARCSLAAGYLQLVSLLGLETERVYGLLTASHLCLYDSDKGRRPIGTVALADVVKLTHRPGDASFVVATSYRLFRLTADSSIQAQDWVDALHDCHVSRQQDRHELSDVVADDPTRVPAFDVPVTEAWELER